MNSSLCVQGCVREQTAPTVILPLPLTYKMYFGVWEDVSWIQGSGSCELNGNKATDCRNETWCISLSGFLWQLQKQIKIEPQQLSSNYVWQNNDLYSILHQRKYKFEEKPHRQFNNSRLEWKLPLPVHRSVTFIPKRRLNGRKCIV